MDVNTQPLFFPEPFAVFQYYRNEYLEKSSSSEIVLIVDIGGGTFNSCIIKTTDDGYLSRGGGTSVPLGLQAEICGGATIDRDLLNIIIKKAEENGLNWKDDPKSRAEREGSPVLLKIEDAKIQLSDDIGSSAKLAEDQSHVEAHLFFEKGELHPEENIDVTLNGEDLKSVIRNLWRRKYGHIIIQTISEAKEKLKNLNFHSQKIDKVIVAGGSSKLPFMREEIKTVIPTMVDENEIFIAPYLGRSVAYGLAFEGLEQISRNTNLSTNKIVPCLLNELYIGFKKDRKSSVVVPKIRYGDKILKDGQLISEPFIIEDYVLEYEFEMPFEVNDKLFYYFSDRPFDSYDLIPLNAGNDVVSINSQNKIVKKWKLEININKNGIIKPAITFKEKGKGAKKEGIRKNLPEFQFQNFNLKEGKSFIGIDFGTTNSYVVQFIKTDDEYQDIKYPQFEISSDILNKVRKLESELIELKDSHELDEERLIKYSHNQMLKLVFHSNKIEGNPLTQGETERVLEKTSAAELSTREREAFNLQEAYDWMIANHGAWRTEPEGFLRNINKMILKGIFEENGNYRKKFVKISGVDFNPPISSSIPSFMEELSKELKNGCEDRSVIEFATSVHTKFVAIHPFVDGNGRTARLLVNSILLNHNLPPIIVNYADKQRYLFGLEGSNKGDLSGLLDFFIECFYESLEDYKNWLNAPEESGDKDREADPACGVEPVDPSDNPINLALKEIGADLESDPIELAMQPKIEKHENLMKVEYESWKNSFLFLKSELFSINEAFNSNERYRSAGFKMKVLEYDLLSFDKYLDLCSGKKVSRTWFMGFDVMSFDQKERILFFFVNTMRRLKDLKLNPVSLILARSDNGSYRILEAEPIRFREIGYSDGQLLFFQSDDEVEEGNVKLNLSNLIADVIKSYL